MSSWFQYPLNRSLGEHRAVWDALLTQLDYVNPILQSDFVDSSLKYFGDGSEVLFVCKGEKSVEAMAVLKPRSLGIWTTFLPQPAQLGPILFREAPIFQSIFGSLPRSVGQVDLLCLDPKFYAAYTTDFSLHSAVDHYFTISIDLVGGLESYWTERSINLTKNIRRIENRILQLGKSCDFRVHVEPEGIERALERYCILESTGWKGKAGTVLALGNEQHRFYEELLTRFAATGCASVQELWFDDELVASQLCIQKSTMCVILKSAHAESASRIAPGGQLLVALIRQQFEMNPSGAIEFYANVSEDEVALATDQRWISHYSFYRNEQIRALLEAAKPILRVVKSPRHGPANSISLHVESYQRIAALPDAVRNCLLEAESANIEQGADWYENLVQTVFPNDPGVRIYALFQNAVAIAVLPVRVTSDRSGKKIEALGNFYTSLYQPYFSDQLSADALAFMLKSMVTENGNISGFRFSPMDVCGHPYRLLKQALQRAGLPIFSYYCFGNWYLKGGMTWLNYFKTRTGNMRSNMKRAKNRFSDEGGLLEFFEGGLQLESGIQDFQHVYNNSWKNEEPYPDFIPGLIRLLSSKGMLRLCIARLNGQSIGAQLWIVANGKASIFKVAYHEDFKKYSIGYLIGGMLTEHVLEIDKVKEIDFLIGDDPYKALWMSDRRERWGIVAYNPKTLRGLLGFGQEVLWRLLKPLLGKFTKNHTKADD